ncbi:FCD domain protein [Mycobacterium xenopi 4042]|uniref:FCD domain protein n=1 Tax=Mycobacterium xenopi 4042 TaxID=1299334 RepID=X8E411_MYCXE|nr:FCD domain protein [Mycobacterium xenopi 4042]
MAQQSIKHHRRVLAALEKRDDRLARKAMSEHLAAGAIPLIEHLVERGVVDEAIRRDSKRSRRSPS